MAPTFSSLKAGTSAGLSPLPSGSGSFGSGSDSGAPARPPPAPMHRNALSASSAAGSPADAYAAALSAGSSAVALPTAPAAVDSLEGRHPEKGILKNKKIGDLQELANLLSDKVRHSVGPEQPSVVELPAPAAPPFQVSLPPRLPPPPPPLRHSLHLECSHVRSKPLCLPGSACVCEGAVTRVSSTVLR